MLHKFNYIIVLFFQELRMSTECDTNLSPTKGRLRYEYPKDGANCKWNLPTKQFEECDVMVVKVEAAQLEFDGRCRSYLYVPLGNGFSRRCNFRSGWCYIFYRNEDDGFRQQILSDMKRKGLTCTMREWHRFNGTVSRTIRVQTDTESQYNPYMELSYEFSYCAANILADDIPDPRIYAHVPTTKNVPGPTKSCDGLLIAIGILSAITAFSLAVIVYLILRLRSSSGKSKFDRANMGQRDEVSSQRAVELKNELYHTEELQTVGSPHESVYTYIK